MATEDLSLCLWGFSDCGSFRVCGEGLQNQVLLDICGINGSLKMWEANLEQEWVWVMSKSQKYCHLMSRTRTACPRLLRLGPLHLHHRWRSHSPVTRLEVVVPPYKIKFNSICKWGISSTMAPTSDIHSPSKPSLTPKDFNTCFSTQLNDLSQGSMSSKSVLNVFTAAWGFSHFLPLLPSSLTHIHTSYVPTIIGEQSWNSI